MASIFRLDRKTPTETRHGRRVRSVDNALEPAPDLCLIPSPGVQGGAQLMCNNCKSKLLNIIQEPVARKERTRTASRVRVIAKCPNCNTTLRIKFGGISGAVVKK
jgi:hypothetical protein